MREAPVETVDLGIEDMLAIGSGGYGSSYSIGRSLSPPQTSIAAKSGLSTIPPSLRTKSFGVRSSDPNKRSVQQMIQSIAASFVHMFRHDHSLPPFIHRNQPLDTNSPGIVPALATCKKLLNQYFAASRTDRSSTWSLIQQESERIWFGHESFTHWELLSSLQALLFYSILRITAPPSSRPSPDADLPFLICVNHVVLALTLRLSCRCDKEILESESMPHDSWVFFETRRRTLCMYRVLSLMVDISDAMPCIPLPQFAIIPLQMPEILWNADGPDAWRRGFDKVAGEDCLFGMTDKGGLKKMEKTDEGMEACDHPWEEWCAGSGQLGILVATVAQLL